ncbi:aquaporin-2 [Conger conger]|uniref:aquaporin-2 n=1 Tax=Conger conger TaxID=82655 RepID=UPI002A59BD35|nr:aquaporin-2 [Conger conger]
MVGKKKETLFATRQEGAHPISTTVPLPVSADMRLRSRLALVLKGLWSVPFLRDVLCEFVGTALFLFAGLASVVLWGGAPGSEGGSGLDPASTGAPAAPSSCLPAPLRVGLAFGSALALVSACLGPATSAGVHLNPAVTVAMVAGLRAPPWRAVLYVGAQLLGALSACSLLQELTPPPLRGQRGLTELAPGVCSSQAFSVESAVSFLLVLCVVVSARPKSPLRQLGPFAVGLSVVLGHLVAMGVTGCGMNPARSFGPALMAQNFHNHWVYWAGPCTGAVLAVAVHDLLLHPRWGCPGDWLAELREVVLSDARQPSRPPERPAE